MKKFFTLLLTLSLLLSVFLPVQTVSAADAFSFHSAPWGSNWEIVKGMAHINGTVYSSDSLHQVILSDQSTYMDVPAQVYLQFDTQNSRSPGFCQVIVLFAPEDGNALQDRLENVYGPLQKGYSDKNGFFNALNPGGWASGYTLEDVLSTDEINFFTRKYADMEKSRLECILRQPLVTVTFDKANGSLTINANTAASAQHIKNEYDQ